jgi:hypothetical protein
MDGLDCALTVLQITHVTAQQPAAPTAGAVSSHNSSEMQLDWSAGDSHARDVNMCGCTCYAGVQMLAHVQLCMHDQTRPAMHHTSCDMVAYCSPK